MQRRSVAVSATEEGWAGRFEAMGSPCEVLLDQGSRDSACTLTRRIAEEAWRIEQKFSRYVDGNVIDRINRADGESITLDEETARLVEFAATLYELTAGRFDITSGVLRQVWRFDGSDQVPAAADVEHILRRVGWHKVVLQNPAIRLQPGMEIDLGGIGKEYAVDRCVALARENSEQPLLVNFGGDLAVTRQPRSRDAWSVAIDRGDGSAGDVLCLSQGALATSGDSRRFVLKDGERYGHILDPTTGWPVSGAPTSVTVAAETCTQAGMLSTMAMLEGSDAEDFLDAQGTRYWCRR